ESQLTDMYTLSLHDALPIFDQLATLEDQQGGDAADTVLGRDLGVGVDVELDDLQLAVELVSDGLHVRSEGTAGAAPRGPEVHERSEEHTSELQSRENLVCRL